MCSLPLWLNESCLHLSTGQRYHCELDRRHAQRLVATSISFAYAGITVKRRIHFCTAVESIAVHQCGMMLYLITSTRSDSHNIFHTHQKKWTRSFPLAASFLRTSIAVPSPDFCVDNVHQHVVFVESFHPLSTPRPFSRFSRLLSTCYSMPRMLGLIMGTLKILSYFSH